jgi:ketohexokinase
MRVLAVGGATLDIVNVVDAYPEEDQELRATSQQQCRGGNATNTLTILSQLGHQCSWAGMLGDDAASWLVRDDLKSNGIDTQWVKVHFGGVTPTSYILSSLATGSRTIVHHRDLPEYRIDAFRKIDLTQYDWIHFEGRDVSAVGPMIRHARDSQHTAMISLEIEKPRPGIETLVPLTDVTIFSKAYALSHGFNSASELFEIVLPKAFSTILLATWGEEGAWLQSATEELLHVPAYHPKQVVDTLGAGDVFNAGVIDGLISGKCPASALACAVRLAGIKCGQRGLAIV